VLCVIIGLAGVAAAWARSGDVGFGPVPGPGPPPAVVKRMNESAAIFGVGACAGVPLAVVGILLVGSGINAAQSRVIAPTPVWILVTLWTVLSVVGVGILVFLVLRLQL
jgi:hypothetical protein